MASTWNRVRLSNTRKNNQTEDPIKYRSNKIKTKPQETLKEEDAIQIKGWGRVHWPRLGYLYTNLKVRKKVKIDAFHPAISATCVAQTWINRALPSLCSIQSFSANPHLQMGSAMKYSVILSHWWRLENKRSEFITSVMHGAICITDAFPDSLRAFY